MSFEWNFLSLQSISGSREWVHKAHGRHINIPIGLTRICSRLLLFIIIVHCVCVYWCAVTSSYLHRLVVQSNGKRIYEPHDANDFPYKSSHLNTEPEHTLSGERSCIWKSSERKYSSSFTVAHSAGSLTGKFMVWPRWTNLWPTIIFEKVAYANMKMKKTARTGPAPHKHTHTHSTSQVPLWTTYVCVSPTIS